MLPVPVTKRSCIYPRGMQTCLAGSFNFGNVSTQAPSIFQTNYAYRIILWNGTVDGRNPKQPPGMYENPVNNGINSLSSGAGFWPSTVSPGRVNPVIWWLLANVIHKAKIYAPSVRNIAGAIGESTGSSWVGEAQLGFPKFGGRDGPRCWRFSSCSSLVSVSFLVRTSPSIFHQLLVAKRVVDPLECVEANFWKPVLLVSWKNRLLGCCSQLLAARLDFSCSKDTRPPTPPTAKRDAGYQLQWHNSQLLIHRNCGIIIASRIQHVPFPNHSPQMEPIESIQQKKNPQHGYHHFMHVMFVICSSYVHQLSKVQCSVTSCVFFHSFDSWASSWKKTWKMSFPKTFPATQDR